MKKFDFGKEFGNIDSKYIEEAEGEWKGEKEEWTPRIWSKVAAACAIVTLGSVIFSNPHVQAAIKSLTLSIGETLGFSKGIESYTQVLDMSQTDNGITATLEEVVVDDGVLVAKIHAEKADPEETKEDQNGLNVANMAFSIDDRKTTVNGQAIEEYGSGDYYPYSLDNILDSWDENSFDTVLESRFQKTIELGDNPEIHLVFDAYKTDDYFADNVASFTFDFSVSRAELRKQTIHKKLDNLSIETEKGTITLTDFSLNKLQSVISAEVPRELYQNYDVLLKGTDSKGNLVQYDLTGNVEASDPGWSFGTNLWGLYSDDSERPILLIPDIDSEYVELQLYLMPIEGDTAWEGDDFAEVGETTETVEEVPEDTSEDETASDTEDPVETQIIGGADGPTSIDIQESTEDNPETITEETIVDEDDDFEVETEDNVWDNYMGFDDRYEPVGEKIKIQIR